MDFKTFFVGGSEAARALGGRVLRPSFKYCRIVKRKTNDFGINAEECSGFWLKRVEIRGQNACFYRASRQKMSNVISSVFPQKVLTNHDTVCYNIQAVRERGARKAASEDSGEP